MIGVNLSGAERDNMKLFPIGLISALAFTLSAQAEVRSMEQLIAAYETYVMTIAPAQAAREKGESPTRWSDVRPETISSNADMARALLEDARAPQYEGDVNAAILARLLEADIQSAAQDAARIPFTGDWGFQAEPLFAALQTRIRTEQDAVAWISRLNDVPRYFSENIQNMRRGVETGWTAHADPLKTMSDQIREQLVEDPAESQLFAPFANLDEIVPEARAAELRTEGLAAVSQALRAYRDTLRFIETEYAPHTRSTAGIGGMEAGKAVYADAVSFHTAGAGYTPEEIHMLGNEEVARIRGEMEAILADLKYEGSFSDFLVFLRSDPQFYAETPEDLMAEAKEISARLDEMLPRFFKMLPRLGYTVDPVPAAIAPGYTTGRYVQGDEEEQRPGSYLVNTYALDQRPLYELPALSAHEAVPGHHLQIALAQEMPGQPKFRRDYYATAFGEGWGLYAERLAGEGGIYTTPYEQFGALSMEMWRACRLVADTGMHYYGWTREQGEACFKENSALAPLNIQTEVTRYIGWPGQAVAYKVGELKIRELRARAEAALGDQFDIRDFHHAVLRNGSVPLDVLEQKIDEWIAFELAYEEAKSASVGADAAQ